MHGHGLPFGRIPDGVLLGALLITACACGDDPVPACGVQRAPIFHGSADPTPLSLTSAQRSAIVAIESNGSPACTGTVIGRGWAITAAHCADFAGLGVVLGEERVELMRTIAHPELDVMLLELPPSGELEPLQPLAEPIDESWLGRKATLAGRGTTETGAAGELLFAREPIVDITGEELWVDGQGRTGACVGDSGGPLLLADWAGRARIAGVLDRGSADCLGLDVYTRIDALDAWLRETVGISSAPHPAACD